MDNERIKQTLAVAALAVLFAIGYGRWAYESGYWHCPAFNVTNSAKQAMACGNYHFGVYGLGAYDIHKAEYYFSKAAEIDPTTPDLWHQYARVAFLEGDFATALERINRQFAERGDELMASYYIRGLIHGYSRQYEKAEQDFKKFLTWNPDNWAANNDLAWVYFAQGKYAEAQKQSWDILARDLTNPWLLTMHAMASYNLGDSKTARAELAAARDEAARLTDAEWIRAYPGNDPDVASLGIKEFRATIERNLELVNSDASARQSLLP